MKSGRIHLKIAVILLLIYELSISFFPLDGLSLFKIIITSLVWVSFGVALNEYIRKHRILHKDIPVIAVSALIMLLGWNILGVLRSILTQDGSMITIIGNTYTSLALLIPFVVVFANGKRNFKIMNDFFVNFSLAGISMFFVFYILSLGSLNVTQLKVSFLLLQPIAFLIVLLPFQKKSVKFLILIGAIALFYVSAKLSIRTMMIREILHSGALVAIYLIYRYRFKLLLFPAILALFIPLLLLQQGIATGESPFEKYLSTSTDNEYSIDTRTFLYSEVYLDLMDTNRMLIGKGANGRYYSEYFSTVEGDSPIRLNIEVGVLGMLLKGGIIAVVLNLVLFVTAIYFAFFRSKNMFVIGIGFILLFHTVLLFVENVISYSSYNFAIWFFVGLCLSRKMRELDNHQIKAIMKIKINDYKY